MSVADIHAEPERSGPRLGDYLRYLTVRRLAKLAYGIVVSLLVGELAITVVSPRQEILPENLVVRDKALGFRMVANFRGVEPTSGIPLEINSLGLRERDLGAPSEDTLRLYVLGDSIVFGLGVTPEEAFPRALERTLGSQLGRPVEVINGGIPGYGTLQELKLFEETVELLKPDIVLLTVSVFNDVNDNLKFANPQKRWQNTPSAIFQPLRWLREHSQLYLMTRRYRSGVSAETMMDIHAVEPSAKTARGLALTEESLTEFAVASEKHGAAFGVIVAPAQKQASARLWNETLRGHGLDADAYAYDQPNRRLEDFARRHGLLLLDLLPALRRESEGIYENEHWKPEGHERVAAVIAEFLRQKQIVQARANPGGRVSP